jgi:hypothetical protein
MYDAMYTYKSIRIAGEEEEYFELRRICCGDIPSITCFYMDDCFVISGSI